MRRLFLVALVVLALLGLVNPAPAQVDPLSAHLVPPEAIMQHQEALGITDSQREQIKGVVGKAQGRFTELEWDLQAEMEKLHRLLADRSAPEEAVLAQLDQTLAAEAKIKRTQVGMLLSLRRLLTREQFEQARRFHRERSPEAEALRRHLEQQRARPHENP